MFIKSKKSLVILFLVLSVVLAYLLFNPDLLAFQTRIIAIKEAYRTSRSVSETLGFIQQIEKIRAKYEIRKQMTLEESHLRDAEVRRVLSSKEDIEELLNYLQIYGKAMYLRNDGTGTYQVAFFEILRNIQSESNKSNEYRQNILKIRDDLNLSDTDLAEFNSILEGKNYP